MLRLKLPKYLSTYAILLLFIITTLSTTVEANEAKKFFSEFLSTVCCYTNSCCWEIPKEAVTQLSDGSWIINSTQQHMPPAEAMSPKDNQLGHTVFSPDGKYYRCACDASATADYEQNWIRHQGANTRCLAIPMQGF